MATQVENPGLEQSLIQLQTLDQNDPGVVRARTVLQEELAFDESEIHEPPPEPLRKEVAGTAAGGAALLVAWVLSEVGISMPGEVVAALAVLVGALAAYLKSEDLPSL